VIERILDMANNKIYLICILFIVLCMPMYLCNMAYPWVDSNNNVRSDVIDGDHEGLDWVIPNGTVIAGVHTNIGNLIIPASNTVNIKAYDGSNYGSVELWADDITISGTLNATNRGYGGGGGGGGSFGNGSWNGIKSEPSGNIGLGGAGVSGGQIGSNSFGAYTHNHGNNTAFGGSGGKGGGPYGGKGGYVPAVSSGATQAIVESWASKVGPAGAIGGYAGLGTNADISIDKSIQMGSGGGGAAGGTSQRTGRSQANSGAAGSGGGGAGGRGGGAIKLYASGILEITGKVLSKGGVLAGNGVSGSGRSGATGGNGGHGGNAGYAGQMQGGQMTWEYPYGGYSGGRGGSGAGGGILLHAGVVTIGNNATIDARGGGNLTANGGTVKIFSVYDNYSENRILGGRLYAYEYKKDIGYKISDGSQNITIACEPEEWSISSLRINKGGVNYSVKLVDPSHPKASKIKIKTPEGVKALQKY
jgi:hypothetical protein